LKTSDDFQFPGLGERVGRRPQDGSSFSGNERDRLFLNVGAGTFDDVSGVSGLDHPGDGRSMALLDIERDGRIDAVTVSANAPWVQLFRNQIDTAGRGFLALRFVGASTQARPQARKSNRDGYGVLVEVDVGDGNKLVREHRAGEGFAAQNSPTMLIGIGARAKVARLSLRWPSGQEQSFENVAAGTLLTAFEDASMSPQGTALATAPYAPSPAGAPVVGARRDAQQPLPPRIARPQGAARLRVLAAFATWCKACAKHAPSFAVLRETLGDSVELVGLPMDAAEDSARIEGWLRETGAVYAPVLDMSEQERTTVRDHALRTLRREALPYTLVTAGAGNVVWSGFGVPTVSDLRPLLDAAQ